MKKSDRFIEAEKECFSGKVYDPNVMDLMMYQAAQTRLVNKYNKTNPTLLGLKKRTKLINKIFNKVGEGCYIEPPFHANFGGKHVNLGNHVYANFNLTLVDDNWINIGDNVMIGPNVTIATANHPKDPEERKKALQYNLPVTIEENVWIGANVVIVPGVTIGANSIIGAGSVVTKNIPNDSVAVGNPCKVIKSIYDK